MPYHHDQTQTPSPSHKWEDRGGSDQHEDSSYGDWPLKFWSIWCVMDVVSTPTICISFWSWRCALFEYQVHFEYDNTETLPSLLILVTPQFVKQDWYRNRIQRNEPEMRWGHILTNWMMGRMPTFGLWAYRVHDVQKGHTFLMIIMGNMKCYNMMASPSHHHHHINEKTERAKNGIGMVDILCLWSVLMDIVESLSVGGYWMTIFCHFAFPVKFVRGMGLLSSDFLHDVMICLSVLYVDQLITLWIRKK